MYVWYGYNRGENEIGGEKGEGGRGAERRLGAGVAEIYIIGIPFPPIKNSISRRKIFFLFSFFLKWKNPRLPFLSLLFPFSIHPDKRHFSLFLFLFIQSPHWFHPKNHTPALPSLAVPDPFSPARTRRSGSRDKGRTSLRSRRIRQLARSPDVCRPLFDFRKSFF